MQYLDMLVFMIHNVTLIHTLTIIQYLKKTQKSFILPPSLIPVHATIYKRRIYPRNQPLALSQQSNLFVYAREFFQPVRKIWLRTSLRRY